MRGRRIRPAGAILRRGERVIHGVEDRGDLGEFDLLGVAVLIEDLEVASCGVVGVDDAGEGAESLKGLPHRPADQLHRRRPADLEFRRGGIRV